MPANKSPLTSTASFQKTLIEWFTKEAKSYPWRLTQDPWAILVSEIMLQQTQVKTVLGSDPSGKGGHYLRFMALYPTPSSMAAADEQEILKAWEGLGYYRRARNLHAAARAITHDHAGIFPRSFEEIGSLPGIGPYTVGAVCSFAYDEPRPIVDANVARVFSRLFDYQERIDTTAGTKQLWQWASDLLPKKNARQYNSALMELGQSYCANKSPDCPNCPVRKFCQTTDPASLPIKKSATKISRIEEFALYTRDSHGRILLQQQETGKRRAGMWSLPRRPQEQTIDLPLCLKTTYHITRYHVTLSIFSTETAQREENEQWHRIEDLESLPMPSPDRRALESILD